jgi:hypothetical protein
MFLLCQFNLMQTIDGLVYSISVISWRSVLLLEEIGVPGENHRPVSSHVLTQQTGNGGTGYWLSWL